MRARVQNAHRFAMKTSRVKRSVDRSKPFQKKSHRFARLAITLLGSNGQLDAQAAFTASSEFGTLRTAGTRTMASHMSTALGETHNPQKYGEFDEGLMRQ